MISVSFKFSITLFPALWTIVLAHSEQNLMAAEVLMYSFYKRAYVDGNSSSENSVLRKHRCEKKSNLLNSCVVVWFWFLIIYFQSPLMQNIFDNCL